ncbi:hypothetical protein Q4485_02265 [Granulosicoccaceae sp. 1_MG-2023]|nr:hypothetical protein [Granulosicoccaceae sp. 1_MG-2023]
MLQALRLFRLIIPSSLATPTDGSSVSQMRKSKMFLTDLVFAALVGFTIGTVSGFFVRSKRRTAKIMVIITGVSGALIISALALALGVALPVPAVAAAGALAALTLRLIFHKPPTDHRRYLM